MRIRFLKSIACVYGGFAPGAVVDIPDEALAEDWCKKGIAEKDTGTGEAIPVRRIYSSERSPEPKILKEKPDKISKKMFWCGKCHALHKLASRIGIRHFKHRA